jgi:predicted nucleotide-binding protein (sugar kinase/HSP70/actin superfamily)
MRKKDKQAGSITIGIPKALMYYKYAQLWETFFHSLGIESIVSPDTNKEIMAAGVNLAVDETCLPSKVFLGHVDWLRDKCDMILVPRISSFGKWGTVCTKHQAIYDVILNTFRGQELNLLHYNIERDNLEAEVSAFIKLGGQLGKKKSQSLMAYWNAKQAQKAYDMVEHKAQQQLLDTDKIKILVIAHKYNLYDTYVGEPVIKSLERLGTLPVDGSIVDRKTAMQNSAKLSETLPWALNRELVGAIAEYQDKVDGIILLSSFPCGPDSMVNEIIMRKIQNKPILNLILDGQEGSAGMETRLESFVDLIKYRRSGSYG